MHRYLLEWSSLLFDITLSGLLLRIGVGETTCSGAFGGVITSGGGFSNVNDRATTAPWQEDAVNTYLLESNSQSYPPLSYFNSTGRGYPDVATYGSNYFVYLNGLLTRLVLTSILCSTTNRYGFTHWFPGLLTENLGHRPVLLCSQRWLLCGTIFG